MLDPIDLMNTILLQPEGNNKHWSEGDGKGRTGSRWSDEARVGRSR